MVIQIFGPNGSGKEALFRNLIEKRNGREIRLGRRLIGWNLTDTIVLRTESLSHDQVCGYVRHFAKQRHVVLDGIFPPATSDPYRALAREVKDYLFAFMDMPVEVHFTQPSKREQLKNDGYELVTLRQARFVQQVEALLLSARFVSGCHEALTLPKATARRRTCASVKATQAA